MKLELKEIGTEPGDAETYSYGPCTIHVIREEYPDSPRDWDNVWTLYSNMRDHAFDKSGTGKYSHYLTVDDLLNGRDPCDKDQRQERESTTHAILRIAREENSDCFIRPVYGHSHGGLDLSLGPFSDPWDSGLAAIAVCEKKKAEEEFALKEGEDLEERAVKCLESEIETLQKYNDGEVYRFTVEDSSGREIDSCGGYFEDPEDVAREATLCIKEDNLYECLPESGLINRLSDYFKSCGKRFDRYYFTKEHSNEKGWQTTLLTVSGDGLGWSYSADQIADMLGYGKGEFYGQTLKAWPKSMENKDLKSCEQPCQ